MDTPRARILVTGASGNVGREVFFALDRERFRVVAGVRDPYRFPHAHLHTEAPRRLDFLDRSTWPSALASIDYLFLVRPPAISDVQNSLNLFVDEALARNVKHIVFLSVVGADRNRFIPHAKVEKHLDCSGISHTNLRPGFFAQNLQDAYLQDINEDNRIFLPAGRSQVNWIDVRDLAEVTAMIFAAPKVHESKFYSLTGPGPVPWSKVTEVLSDVSGRQIRYEAVSVLAYIRHLWRRRLPVGAIVVQTILHTLLRYGSGEFYSPTLEQLLGRPARSIETYIRDNASIWQVNRCEGE